MSSTKAPPEIYGNILGFLSPEDALNIVKNNTKLAPAALRYYPWDLSQKRVCKVFNKKNIRAIAYNTSIDPDTLLKCAMDKFMDTLTIKILETKEISTLTKNKALIEASTIHQLDIVRLLLKKGADPSYRGSKALFVGLSSPKVVEELLMDPRTNPYLSHDVYGVFYPGQVTVWYPLAYASFDNNLDTVEILLKHISENPKKKVNHIYWSALTNASRGNHLEMVKLLLKYIPKLKYVLALIWAIDNKNYNILGVLLKSKKILFDRPSIINVLGTASRDITAMDMLLQDPKFENYIHHGLMYAVENTIVEMVEYILSWRNPDGTKSLVLDNYLLDTNTNVNNNMFLVTIEESQPNKALKIISALLKDGRADPSSNDNVAIITAVNYGKTPIVRLLLKDPRVNTGDLDDEIITDIFQRGPVKNEVIKLLANSPGIHYKKNLDLGELNAIYFMYKKT